MTEKRLADERRTRLTRSRTDARRTRTINATAAAVHANDICTQYTMTDGPMPPFSLAVSLVAVLVVACPWPSRAAPPRTDGVFRLLVLHTNDIHSRFEQTDLIGNECTVTAAGRCYGGFPRLRTAVRQARAQATGTVDGTLFLNAGDSFQGTPFYTFFRWSLVARMVQLLDIDVMVSLRRLSAVLVKHDHRACVPITN